MALEQEVNLVAERIQACINENARVALDQEEYETRYNRLVVRFDKAKARYDKVMKLVAEKKARREQIETFLRKLKKLDLFTDFDEDLWLSLIGSATVRSKEDIRFMFKDGTEIKAE